MHYLICNRYGSQLIKDEILSAGNVTTVFFSIITGAMALGYARTLLVVVGFFLM
jgi:hypothetical protein